MKTIQICPICRKQFVRIWARNRPSPIYCSHVCANKAPNRMTPEIKAKIGLSGEKHPNWKQGQWLAKGGDGRIYMRVWISPQDRYLYPACLKGYVPRSHIIWNQNHPSDLVKKGEVVHHIDGNSLNDILPNLQKFHSPGEHMQNHGRILAPRRIRNIKGQFL